MHAHPRSIPRDETASMPWWRQLSLTAFAVIATSHLAELRPHGPLMAAMLFMFVAAQVREILEEDPAAPRGRYVSQVFAWTLAGPLLAGLAGTGALSPALLARVRLAAALVFLQCDGVGQLGEVWTYGRAALRDAALALAVDLLLVWLYCGWVL